MTPNIKNKKMFNTKFIFWVIFNNKIPKYPQW